MLIDAARMEKDFCCPICKGTLYRPAVIYRQPQPPYVLPFFICMGCSVLFSDVWQFTHCRPNGYQFSPTSRQPMAPPSEG